MEWLWSFDLRYHGVDFLGMGLSFGSIWQLARKRRSGFLFGATASVAWLVFGVMAQSAGTVYANAIFGVMHSYAWWRWKHESVAATPGVDAPGRLNATGR